MFGGDWEPAEAVIVTERPLTNWTRQVGGSVGVPHEYVADVTASGQPTFRATFHEPLTHGHYDHPKAGDRVKVLFQSKSKKVKLDPQYKIGGHDQEKERDSAFNELADAAPGTSPAGQAAQSRVLRPPAEGDEPGVTRLAPPGPPASSAADQLAKLAELRQSGALSDSEFEAEKAKVLAQD